MGSRDPKVRFLFLPAGGEQCAVTDGKFARGRPLLHLPVLGECCGGRLVPREDLFPLEGGGYVADTPGWKSLALWDTEPEEMDAYFPELRELVQHCQFSNCSHTHEPKCAVLDALKDGRVHKERYESYLRLRDGKE